MFWMLNVFIQWWSNPFNIANAVINQPPLYLFQRSFLQISISARLFVHSYSYQRQYNQRFFALKFLPSFQFFKTSEKCLKYFIYITIFILYGTCRSLIIFMAPIAFRHSYLNHIFVHGAYFYYRFFSFIDKSDQKYLFCNLACKLPVQYKTCLFFFQ